MDQVLRDLRKRGMKWEDISGELGISRNSALARGRRLGLFTGGSKTPQSILPPSVEREIRRGTDALSPGNSSTWNLLTRGTSLEDSPWDLLLGDIP